MSWTSVSLSWTIMEIMIPVSQVYKLRREKTCFVQMQKQRHTSAVAAR